ncbi:MAG: thioredoxin domain-containing protein [Planctomycetes bacterium]|nr:thioredoxin domain-containing protein [Planctomycetota bacterium]
MRGVVLAVCLVASALRAPACGEDATEPGGARTGGWRLAKEKSLYLREHAENPVEWYPWGEEAIAAARRLDRPILLSIGYSSCHWCHVMRRESFADDKVAAALASTCVAIKVDREELPHVDDAYMDWVQRYRGGGGWPLTVFLTPDLKPFFGGTYFPREEFLRLVAAVGEKWRTERDKLVQGSAESVAALAAADQKRGEPVALRALIDRGVAKLSEQYDAANGGFAIPPAFAPKFPNPRAIALFLSLAALEDRTDLREQALHTLRRMASGGIFDQVGGGFHRYAVDPAWAVPHFEKMLYNQGMLAEAYLEAYRLTGEEGFREVAWRTLDAMLRDFAVEGGGFAASWDADSEEREGIYYAWDPAQVESAAGAAAPLLCEFLGVKKPGNFEHGLSVPSRAAEPEALAKKLGLAPEECSRRLEAGLAALLAARAKRIAPKRDDKVILGWNATAVSALARAGIVLKEIRFLRAAELAHAFVDKHLAPPSGFLRRYAGGSADHGAALQDAALHLKACLDLYHATFRPQHVARAIELVAAIEREFGAAGEPAGALFEMAEGAQVLLPRRKLFADDALTSGNGTLAGCLLRLHGLTGEARYREQALRILEDASRALGDYPHAAPEMLLAALMATAPMPEVAIAGDLNDRATQALMDAVIRCPFPFVVYAHRPGGEPGEFAARTIPLLSARTPIDGKPAAYLCVNFNCLAPETDAAKLVSALAAAAKPRREEAKQAK